MFCLNDISSALQKQLLKPPFLKLLSCNIFHQSYSKSKRGHNDHAAETELAGDQPGSRLILLSPRSEADFLLT